METDTTITTRDRVHLKGSTLVGEYTRRLIWPFYNHSRLAVLVETTILVQAADMPVQHPNTFISEPHWEAQQGTLSVALAFWVWNDCGGDLRFPVKMAALLLPSYVAC